MANDIAPNQLLCHLCFDLVEAARIHGPTILYVLLKVWKSSVAVGNSSAPSVRCELCETRVVELETLIGKWDNLVPKVQKLFDNALKINTSSSLPTEDFSLVAVYFEELNETKGRIQQLIIQIEDVVFYSVNQKFDWINKSFPSVTPEEEELLKIILTARQARLKADMESNPGAPSTSTPAPTTSCGGSSSNNPSIVVDGDEEEADESPHALGMNESGEREGLEPDDAADNDEIIYLDGTERVEGQGTPPQLPVADESSGKRGRGRRPGSKKSSDIPQDKKPLSVPQVKKRSARLSNDGTPKEKVAKPN